MRQQNASDRAHLTLPRVPQERNLETCGMRKYLQLLHRFAELEPINTDECLANLPRNVVQIWIEKCSHAPAQMTGIIALPIGTGGLSAFNKMLWTPQISATIREPIPTPTAFC
jgi:hypothetical protein